MKHVKIALAASLLIGALAAPAAAMFRGQASATMTLQVADHFTTSQPQSPSALPPANRSPQAEPSPPGPAQPDGLSGTNPPNQRTGNKPLGGGSLRALLGVHGPFGHIPDLLETRRYAVRFSAPWPGRLQIFWYATRRGGHARVLLARGVANYDFAGPGRARIVLTRRGRKVLSAAKQRLQIQAVADFLPAGTAHRSNFLRRRFTLDPHAAANDPPDLTAAVAGRLRSLSPRMPSAD
jgi:hypothetical protein